MKVALFVHGFFPDQYYGTETYTLEVARNLRDLGHEPTVVAATAQELPRRDALITRDVYDGVPVIRLDKNHEPHTWIRETYWHEAMRPHLRAVLEEIRPDVVHVTHLISHTAVLLEEAKAAGYPLVGTLTDFYGFCFTCLLTTAEGDLCEGPTPSRGNCIECHVKAMIEAGRPGGRLLNRLPAGRKLGAAALQMADAIGGPRRLTAGRAVPDIKARPDILRRAYAHYDVMIAPTRFLHGAYLHNGFDAQRLRRSPFGVDLPRQPKPARPPDAPLALGFVGQIGAHKGLHLLVEAMKALPAAAATLQVYGAVEPATPYVQEVRAAAGPETVFHGPFEPKRMAEVLARIDVLVIPSTWYENSPLVLLNALASHTPVIVSDVPGMTEFVEQGVSGWSFKRGDAASLADVLRRLAADPAAARALSATTAYARTTRDMTLDVLRFYEEAMASA